MTQATPEELDRLAEEAATTFYWDYGSDPRPAIRSAIDQALSLQRESVIEECAKVCDPRNPPEDWTEYAKIKAECATAIRALKG